MSNKWTAAQRRKFMATMKQRKHADYIPTQENITIHQDQNVLIKLSILDRLVRMMEKLI